MSLRMTAYDSDAPASSRGSFAPGGRVLVWCEARMVAQQLIHGRALSSAWPAKSKMAQAPGDGLASKFTSSWSEGLIQDIPNKLANLRLMGSPRPGHVEDLHLMVRNELAQQFRCIRAV